MNAHSNDSTERAERQFSYESTFESLQNPRRRWTLRYLSERDSPVPVSELADQITAWEGRANVADIRPEARKSVYNSLTQTHLPHLANRGIVEYDPSAGTVELAPNAAKLAPYLPAVSTSEDRWGGVVLATTVVAGIVAVVNWLGVFAPTIGAMALNVVVVGLFLAVSLAYAVSTDS